MEIFTGSEGALEMMDEQPFVTERELQELVAAHPELLGGAQMNPQAPRRLVLVDTEAPVPDDEAPAGRWSLDLLFVDQYCVPVLVEVKRARNPQLRREVVGQMLDYIANAGDHWTAQDLAAAFAATHSDDAGQVLATLTDRGDADETDFWERTATNLREGRATTIILADGIPRELRRIVEFLNERLVPTEALAVELRRYRTPSSKPVYTVEVLGMTATAQQTTGAQRKRGWWDRARFLGRLEEEMSSGQVDASEMVEVAEAVLEWADERGHPVEWGRGSQLGTFRPQVEHCGQPHPTFLITTNGKVQILLEGLSPPFDTNQMRQQLLDKLNAIEGIAIPDDNLERGRPEFPLAALIPERSRRLFFETWDWYEQEVRAAADCGDQGPSSN